jgi:hypothetical protein
VGFSPPIKARDILEGGASPTLPDLSFGDRPQISNEFIGDLPVLQINPGNTQVLANPFRLKEIVVALKRENLVGKQLA